MTAQPMTLVRPSSVAAVAISLLALGAAAPALAEEEPTSEPLPTELVEARKICLMDAAVMDTGLKERFRSELDDWERFEIVMFPDEADILMALSARSDFTSRPVEDDCDPDDPLCERAEGTAQVFERLYLKVFVQGGDELWADEEQVGDDDGAAKLLVERLRARMEIAEEGADRHDS